MGNSTTTLQSVVDHACTFPDIAPVLNITAAGYSNQALNIANDVANDMFTPAFNWKWNRFNITPFYTNSWQQDYCSATLNLAWLESAWLVDINNTAYPKPIYPLETNRDLQRTSAQYGRPFQASWLPNDQLVYGTWGGGGPQNPGAGTVYVNPLGAANQPINPLFQIKDTNGNLQLLTTFGTLGSVQPTWPPASSVAGVTTADGTAVWTVVNPKGQGFRLNPLPPQSGVAYQVNLVGQAQQPIFTSFTQTLEPIPDDYAPYFREGFVVQCYRHSPNPATRERFRLEYKLWIDNMTDMIKQADRERESFGFYPTANIMGGCGDGTWGPSDPYGRYS